MHSTLVGAFEIKFEPPVGGLSVSPLIFSQAVHHLGTILLTAPLYGRDPADDGGAER
jgi:hypothetical protein